MCKGEQGEMTLEALSSDTGNFMAIEFLLDKLVTFSANHPEAFGYSYTREQVMAMTAKDVFSKYCSISSKYQIETSPLLVFVIIHTLSHSFIHSFLLSAHLFLYHTS